MLKVFVGRASERTRYGADVEEEIVDHIGHTMVETAHSNCGPVDRAALAIRQRQQHQQLNLLQ